MIESAYEKMMSKERHAVKELKAQLDAWQCHIERHSLESRQEFIEWILRNFTAKQLAHYIEMDWDDDAPGNSKRDELHETYLESRYMGV